MVDMACSVTFLLVRRLLDILRLAGLVAEQHRPPVFPTKCVGTDKPAPAVVVNEDRAAGPQGAFEVHPNPR
jgi:hypothetical protein